MFPRIAWGGICVLVVVIAARIVVLADQSGGGSFFSPTRSFSWTGQHNQPPCPLTDGAIVTVPLGACPTAGDGTGDYFVTLNGNRTITTSGLIGGQSFDLWLTQGATGGFINQTFTSEFNWANRSLPIFGSGGAASVDVLACRSLSSSFLLCGMLPNVGSANEIWASSHASGNLSLSNNNLTATFTGSNANISAVFALSGVVSGRYYAQLTMSFSNNGSTADTAIGLGLSSSSTANGQWLGSGADTIGYIPSGGVWSNNHQVASLASYASGASICEAFDLGNQKIWFQPVGTSQWDNNGTDNPSTNTGGVSISGILGGSPVVVVGANLFNTNDSVVANFATPCSGVTGLSGFLPLP